MYPYSLNLPGNQNLCKQLLARGIFIFVIRPHFSFVRFRYTWKNFKVRLSEKNKNKNWAWTKIVWNHQNFTSVISVECMSIRLEVNFGSRHQLFYYDSLADSGGTASMHPHNGIQFFHFHIHFAEKHPRRRSAPLQWLGTPRTGNPGSAIVIIILMDIT